MRFISRNWTLASFALVALQLLLPMCCRTTAAADGNQRPRLPRKRSDGNDTSTLLHEGEFVSPQVRIQMDCQQDQTTIRANFSRPFQGILGAGNPAKTKCKLIGTGLKYYELRVLHNATDSCDAKWDNSTSGIANTLFIRFHQSLETGADIAKNVLCRLAVGNLVVGRRPSQLKKAPGGSERSTTFTSTQKSRS